ncbi:MAG: YicC family protein [Planctomycetes bacterium]|nr:YicC family protein [Planctomycetota bacterium]
MTGFGAVSEQIDGVHYAVEVRSLNNRYFKAAIRLPDEIAGLEAEIETQLRNRLSRGSITLVGKRYAAEGLATHRINDAALVTYLDHLETLHKKFSKDQSINIDLTALLALPGVLQPEDERAMMETVRPIMQRLTEQACDKLLAMRVREGETIRVDLNKQKLYILERVDAVAQRAPQVVEEYHGRLRTRIDELLKRAELKMDHQDLIREVAIYAERSDVSEEITRLRAHMEQMQRIVDLADGEPAGRTLDFLSQELLREANTIASKSNDSTISRAIVEVKGAIDRIKEQVQNVE